MPRTPEKPFATPAADYCPLEDYGAIGNCRTLALVSRYGSIDWLCLPHFSGPSIFAALLDRRNGGRFSIAPRRLLRAEHRYIPGSNVLETTFHCREGTLKLTDFMSVACTDPLQPQHELGRLAQCASGRVAFDVLYQPRPGYARRVPRLQRRGKLGWACPQGGTTVYLNSDCELVPHGECTLVGTRELSTDQSAYFSLTAEENDVAVIYPLGDALRARLDASVDWWRKWSAQCTYRGPYREAVERSCLVLKLLTFCLSGAIIAAPTTSLPEAAGGSLNWDYRYCWLRDASLVLGAFVDLGYERESRAFLEWMLHATKLTQPRLQVLYDIYGRTGLKERELEHFEGYRGARPVRLGNAAHAQFQLDIYGEVILAAHRYAMRGGRLCATERALLAGFGKTVCELWRLPDHGIWEIRGEPRHHTYSKLMCWAALDALLKLDRLIRLGIDGSAYRRVRDEIRADIETHAYDAQLESYVDYYGGKDPDATLLFLARLGFLAPQDKRMQGTHGYIMRRLSADSLLYRSPPGRDVEGKENLFAACSFWLVDYLARAGRIDEATRLFERLLEAGTDLGLYGEEFQTGTGKPMGNFPQAFTHVELVGAALSLERARQGTLMPQA